MLSYYRNGVPDEGREYLFSVGGNCDWSPGLSVEGVPMYGTIRVGHWKLILGHISKSSMVASTKYFVI